MTELVHELDEVSDYRARLTGAVGLVPTMGALHAGHLALIDAARAECEHVIVSIFVNPMQFDRAADLERYPRPVAADVELCRQRHVDLVWNPSADAMYPNERNQVWVTAAELANQLEGPNRPGHFDGVLTVVTKLFSLVGPDRAYFGEKDYQQLVLIRRLVADLNLRPEIRAVPTVRESDGLALSSRNIFLDPQQRRSAPVLFKALKRGRDAAGDAVAVLNSAHAELSAAEGVDVDYLELRDPDLGPAPTAGPARLLVAARLGSTRLLDNIALELRP